MHEQPQRNQQDQSSANYPFAPDYIPPTIRLRGDPSQSMYSTAYDSLPYDLDLDALTIRIPSAAAPDVSQPSMSMKALKRDQMAVAAFIITSSFFISRILGVFRTTLFGATFGPSNAADAFTLAFTLPNAIYNLIAGGALSSAFIPVFTEYMINKKDKKSAWYITSVVFNVVTLLLTLFAILGAIFMPQLAHLFAYGVFNNPEKANDVIQLSRIMLIQPIMLGLSFIATFVLNARQKFLLPAVGSILYTFGQVIGIGATILDNHTHIFGGHLGILGPTYGVVGAAVAQFIVQIPGLLNAKMQYTPTLNFLHPGVKQIAVLMIPRFINAVALFGIYSFISSAMLSSLNGGVVYGYQQAFQLVLLPIAVFGIALSQAAFPSLAIFVATREWEQMRHTIVSSIKIILFLSIPTSMVMMILARPLTDLLFGYGQFSADKLYVIYIPLIFFAIGAPALSLIEILVRAYYAIQDAKTAVTVGVVELAFVIGLSVILLNSMGAAGLALASSLGATIEATALLIILRSRIGKIDVRDIANFTLGIISAGLVASLMTYIIYLILNYSFQTFISQGSFNVIEQKLLLLTQMSIASVAGILTFFISARFLKMDNPLPMRSIFNRVVGRILRKK